MLCLFVTRKFFHFIFFFLFLFLFLFSFLGSPRFTVENLDVNLKLVDAITVLAGRKGCTVGQLSLAWLHAQGSDVIPIPGKKEIFAVFFLNFQILLISISNSPFFVPLTPACHYLISH